MTYKQHNSMTITAKKLFFSMCLYVSVQTADIISDYHVLLSFLFDELKILYGYISGDPRCLLLNYHILIAKFHIFRSKKDSKSPTFPAFMALLKEKLLVYRAAAVANKTLHKFQTRWTTLLPLLDS